MTAALTGLGSGALHALTGPDHLVSLAPLSLGRARGGWVVGLLWGVGHALGTLLLGGLLLAAASQVPLASAAAWAERIAGAALVAMGAWGLRALRRHAPATSGPGAPVSWRALVTIGLVHGATGAAALLLLLPAAAAASGLQQAVYLGGFSLGSTLAMAGLTGALSAAARWPAAAAVVRRAPAVASAAAIALGAAWVVAA
jgi:hypothetical protein